MSELFGKYELSQRIGMGGMAEVWVARTHGAQGFVKELVIKRILEQFSEDPDFVSMFINEARLASRLQHTNIVQIYDFDQVAGVYYIAMELVDGPDLRRVQATARRRALPVPQTLAVHVGVEALKGLHYAHTRVERGRPLGLVHRDISPHNLLLSHAGEVKITDFGIAKVAALASVTRTGMVKGKLTYMSPEQVRGDSVDARADIYALGIVLWELLTARRFYEGVASEGELVAAARRGAVPPLTTVSPEVPTRLAAVVERMLAAEADQRFSSAADALAELSVFAGATDALEVSDYLRRLLPASAEREERGLTAVAVAGSVGVARPDAPTGTVLPEGASDDPTVLEAPAAARPPTRAPARGGTWSSFALLGTAVFLVTAAAAWWGLRRDDASAAPGLALLEVTSKPSGARIEAEGLPLGGREPLMIGAPRGQVLALVAHWDQRSVRREVTVGRHGAVTLVLPEAKAAPRTAPPPVDHGSPPAPARSADAGSVMGRSATRPRRGPRAGLPKVVKVRPRPDGGHKRPTRPVERAYGRLRVIVSSWARVHVDGAKVGLTPITDKPLRVGRHQVMLENPEIGKKVVITVEIVKGETLTIRRDW